MQNESRIIESSAMHWDPENAGVLDRIGDFALGVGGVDHRHMIVDIHTRDIGMMRKLKRTGAVVIPIDLGCPALDTVDTAAWRGHRDGAAACRLPIGPRSVDVVFADLVLHHLPVPSLAITEMLRILRPGGRLVITEFEKRDHLEIHSAGENRWPGFYPGDLRHWLKNAGFSNIIVNPVLPQFLGPYSAERGRPSFTGFLIATGTA